MRSACKLLEGDLQIAGSVFQQKGLQEHEQKMPQNVAQPYMNSKTVPDAIFVKSWSLSWQDGFLLDPPLVEKWNCQMFYSNDSIPTRAESEFALISSRACYGVFAEAVYFRYLRLVKWTRADWTQHKRYKLTKIVIPALFSTTIYTMAPSGVLNVVNRTTENKGMNAACEL